jgi:LCP family protein required for cell wall assembly
MIQKTYLTFNIKCNILNGMVKTFTLILVSLSLVGLAVYTAVLYKNNHSIKAGFISPVVKGTEDLKNKLLNPNTALATEDVNNILLMGIDRRNKYESAYRTDTMILISVNKNTNRIVMTSIPRDLWHDGERLNAVYIQQGWEGIQSAFEIITGQKPDKYILTDFEDFSWIVDAFGGVPVNVERGFTDVSYPNDITNTYQTISFTEGFEKLSGERALMFARSRKGDFDNGDWGRMKRQHLILKGMAEAMTQPESFLCSMGKTTNCQSGIGRETLEQALKMVTTGKMEANLNVDDLVYLWDFYKDRDKYSIESVYLDNKFLYTPPMDQYGGAWVLAPINGSYEPFHKLLNNKLSGIEQATEEQALLDSGAASAIPTF